MMVPLVLQARGQASLQGCWNYHAPPHATIFAAPPHTQQDRTPHHYGKSSRTDVSPQQQGTLYRALLYCALSHFQCVLP